MFNLKARQWIFALIPALSCSLFANEEEVVDSENIAGWNHSMAAKNIMGSKQKQKNQPSCGPYLCWKGWADFLYWQPIEENLEPAGLFTSSLLLGATGTDTGMIVNMDFDYKPAFAVGAGVLFDRTFGIDAEYTRFYSTQKASGKNNAYYPMQLDPATLISFLNGLNEAANIGGAIPFSFKQKWKLEMDILDVTFGRYKCEQKIVQLHPFIGLRAAWIDQVLKTGYTANEINAGPQIGTAAANVHTKSWGVGIRGGIETTCKIGAGFKFYGNGAGDLLYSQYNWHGQSNAEVTDLVDRSSDLTQKKIPTVRLHLETELGFLWGFNYKIGKACHRGHVDFGAGYGFQVFFNQNMFRHFTTTFEEVGLMGGTPTLVGNVLTPISNSPNGNLYMQGLRVHASWTY